MVKKSAKPPVRPANRPAYVPGKIIVKLSIGQTAPASAAGGPRRRSLAASADAGPLDYLRANYGVESVKPLFAGGARPAGGARRGFAAKAEPKRAALKDLHVVELSATPPDKVLKDMGKARGVQYAERIPNRWLCASGPDPDIPTQWGLAATRWTNAVRPDASGVHVAVLDSGIDANHPELRDMIDTYVHKGNSKRDFVGHGSHVTGIIAAKAGNAFGMAGACNARIHMVKIFGDTFDAEGGPNFEEEYFLQSLEGLLNSDVKVLNLSIGGTASSRTERDLFAALRADGILAVAAMGNEFEDGNPTSYPAAYDDVLAVGAVGETLKRAWFSNTGPHIGVCAPGMEILSTVPRAAWPPHRPDRQFASWQGTSMATPLVAGLATLLFAKNPGKDADWVERRILSTAKKIPAMGGSAKTSAFGTGLIDFKKALG